MEGIQNPWYIVILQIFGRGGKIRAQLENTKESNECGGVVCVRERDGDLLVTSPDEGG